MAATTTWSFRVFLSAILVVSQLPLVDCHGSMIDPAQRSVMWMYGFKTPKNYNFNGLNCGGFVHQWYMNGGKCGLCGDSYSGKRLNEDGGIYSTGLLAKSYNQDAIIEIRVELTANHLGWFEFRLCARNKQDERLTQECLDQHLLQTPDGKTRYYPGWKSNHAILLQLPDGVSCEHCVLQWKYNSGNSWGCDHSFRCCLGCGAQEQFYNCADVEIIPTSRIEGSHDDMADAVLAKSRGKSQKKVKTDKETDVLRDMSVTEITDITNSVAEVDKVNDSDGETRKYTMKTQKAINEPYSPRCKGKGVWETVEGMGKWCEQNCTPRTMYRNGGCLSHCSCKD